MEVVADERLARLEVAHLGLEPADLVAADVRRVRDDEVPALHRDLEPALPQQDGQAGPLDVLGRERQRPPGHVHGGHPRVRLLVGERERDRAGPGADVEHLRLVPVAQELEAALDELLRLGPRHERPLVGREREAAEIPLSEHVGEGLAPPAPLHELPRRRGLRLGQRTLEPGVELDPREPERVREEALRVEPRVLDSLALEELRRAGQHLADRQRHDPSMARRRRPRGTPSAGCRASGSSTGRRRFGTCCSAGPRA